MDNEQIENVPEKAVPHDDKRDLELMEIEIFRQHWRSLNAALAEIKELRGSDAPEIDPVEFVKHEVGTLKSQFAELKEMIAGLQVQAQAQPQSATQQVQPQQRFQTVAPAMMPYFPTPNFTPIIQMPQ